MSRILVTGISGTGKSAALAELERHSGTQFDPDAAEALIEHVRMPVRLTA